ncbi:hypothetical protein H5410_001875, partial [Solanum commersonii]
METSFSRELWYEWVESSRLHIIRMSLSREAIVWVSRRFREASILKGRGVIQSGSIEYLKDKKKKGALKKLCANIGGLREISQRVEEEEPRGARLSYSENLLLRRVLVIPLHLWSIRVIKEIGDKCSGWLETEEETELKNHLRWARIRDKGPSKNILAYIDVEDGKWSHRLQVWCEAPPRYEKVGVSKQQRCHISSHVNNKKDESHMCEMAGKNQRRVKEIDVENRADFEKE